MAKQQKAMNGLRTAAGIPRTALGWTPPTAPARGSGRQEGRTPGDGISSPLGDGKGATQGAGRATGNKFDPTRDPKSGEGRQAGGRNFTMESRGPSMARGGPPPAASDASAWSRPQAATRDPRARVNDRSVPSDGTTYPTVLAPSWRAGTGSVGNARRPFRVK
jgi:hypothetical protein